MSVLSALGSRLRSAAYLPPAPLSTERRGVRGDEQTLVLGQVIPIVYAVAPALFGLDVATGRRVCATARCRGGSPALPPRVVFSATPRLVASAAQVLRGVLRVAFQCPGQHTTALPKEGPCLGRQAPILHSGGRPHPHMQLDCR